MISHLDPALLKRAYDYTVEAATKEDPDVPSRQFYSWAWIVFLANFVIFIPIFILTNYTFEKVLPVFAIVEDEHPPAYEPVALDDETPAASGSVPGTVPDAPRPVNKPASAAVPTRPLNLDGGAHPITSSLMATWRLLRSHGGFRSIFRGFSCLLFQSFIQIWLTFMFASLFGPLFILALVIPSLLLCQFSTAWVHIVLTPHSSLTFWRRLPPFKTTLTATWRPILVHWALGLVSGGVTYLLMSVLGVNHNSSGLRDAGAADSWKALVVYSVSLLLRIFLVIPAYVTLVRVQASLLPDDQETIIPFDRSFQGKVEPAVIGGTGYISLRDAWTTFSTAAWRRLLILYVKITGINVLVSFVIAAIMVPQFFLLSYRT